MDINHCQTKKKSFKLNINKTIFVEVLFGLN